MIVRWARQARLERQETYQYIYEDNGGKAANKDDDWIWRSLEMLAKFPLMKTATRNPAVRHRVIPGTPFIALYTFNDKRVLIKRLLHGAQQNDERGDSL